MRVVPDTNILISAVLWGGNPALLMEAAVDGNIKLLLSQLIIDEVVRVLKRKGLSASRLAEALEYITVTAVIIAPTESLNAVPDDPDDNKILECAVAGKANVIVTGDKHLLKLKQYEGIRIIKVSELLLSRPHVR